MIFSVEIIVSYQYFMIDIPNFVVFALDFDFDRSPPFPEFIDAFVSTAVEEMSCEWRLKSQWLKNEPHHLWYLLKHILAAKFTYLFRGILPGYVHLLADCQNVLHRETCEILAQCETIPGLSFDLARIREGAGLGFADDILDCAFAISKIASLRSIEQANPGYLDAVNTVYAAGPTACHDLTIFFFTGTSAGKFSTHRGPNTLARRPSGARL